MAASVLLPGWPANELDEGKFCSTEGDENNSGGIVQDALLYFASFTPWHLIELSAVE